MFIHFSYPLPSLLTPFPITFTIKGNANNGRNLTSCILLDIGFINDESQIISVKKP